MHAQSMLDSGILHGLLDTQDACNAHSVNGHDHCETETSSIQSIPSIHLSIHPFVHSSIHYFLLPSFLSSFIHACRHALTVACRLQAHYCWSEYWNYLRRQLYVMDTYATSSNKRTNHTLMIIHSYLSWAIIMPATTGILLHFATDQAAEKS